MASKKLYRSCKSRILGGVCGGLGEYFDVDPVLIRLLFIIALLSGGIGFIVYIVAWLAIPNDPKCEKETAEEEIKAAAHSVADTVKDSVKSRKDDNRAIVGVAILIVGIIFLAVNASWIPADVWRHFIIFWPVLIVLFGLGLIFRNAFVYFIAAMLIIAATFYFAIADPYSWQKKDNNRSEIVTPNLIENYDSTIDNFKLTIDLGAAALNVKELNDPASFNLLKGNYGEISHFEETRENDGKTATLSIKEKTQTGTIFDNPSKNRYMDLNLTDQLPLDFTVNAGASSLNLDFSNILLKKLTVNAGASKVDVKLGNKLDLMDAEINCGASALNFTIPKDYGVKIVSNSMLLGRNFGDLNLEQNKNAYSTKDFDKSNKKITINLSSGVSKLTLQTY